MEQQQALEIVRKQMHEKRYIHTLGVMETAIVLAKQYGADVKKAELAAIFHDYAKCRPIQEMETIIKRENMSQDLLAHNKELWHAPVGAYLVEQEVGITDREILQAILYHTSGHPNMTLLDTVIYVADYIEPGRKFPGIDEVRELAQENLQAAMLQAVTNTITFLIERKQQVYPLTLHTYNALVKEQAE